jgi:RNA polymerase sigma factor (sigma-70 family)
MMHRSVRCNSLSAKSQALGSQAALAEFCRIYWSPIYAFVRRREHGADDARDLAQGLFLHMLERKGLTHVDPPKGRFRSFLLASVRNYLSDGADRARRLKRDENMEIDEEIHALCEAWIATEGQLGP